MLLAPDTMGHVAFPAGYFFDNPILQRLLTKYAEDEDRIGELEPFLEVLGELWIVTHQDHDGEQLSTSELWLQVMREWAGTSDRDVMVLLNIFPDDVILEQMEGHAPERWVEKYHGLHKTMDGFLGVLPFDVQIRLLAQAAPWVHTSTSSRDGQLRHADYFWRYLKSFDGIDPDARAEIEGQLVDAPARYSAIRMRISADCEPPGELAKLVTIADRGCIVANTLRQAVSLTVECST